MVDRDEPGGDVAVIGVAALLPGAGDLDELHHLLAAGEDRVAPPTPTRVRHTGGEPGTEYLPMAYLDRIDLFDHRFFGIPLREAEAMDPHHRLLMQLAHEAIENACLRPSGLRGSRTAVILGHARSDYDTLYEEDDPLHTLGSLPAALAARIAYHFDLTGPAFTVDTACSSALAAVAQAVTELRRGAADLALAGGISLRPVLIPTEGHVPARGVETTDGRCRPFDEHATGAAAGEGGAVVLLRRLVDAVAAGDPVHAVIKGIAVNHNGHRMASMGAPSRKAQTEVITAAWRDAGVAADSVGYVECHGSATPLGDVIEVDALRQAFADAGVPAPGCPIGSIKGNLGHLDGAAGMAGLLKALLAVRRGELYPTAHFTTPNPMLDLSGPVHVNPARAPWAKEGPRRAGVSAFGMTGTNVHAVLEQAPPRPGAAVPDLGGELVTVSAKSASAFGRYCERLADFAATTDHDLRTVAHALNRGRDDHPYRGAVTARTTRELAEALRAAVPPREPAPDERPVVVLLAGDAVVEDETWRELCTTFPVLADTPLPEAPAARLVATGVALLALARSLGVRHDHLVGSGAGNLVVRVAREEMTLDAALRAAEGMALSSELDHARLAGVAERFTRDGAVLVDLATGVLARELRRLRPELPRVELFAAPGRGSVLRQLGALHRLGVRLDWDAHYGGADIPRIPAPTYPFDPVRCWCRPVGAPAPQPVSRPASPVPVPGAPEDRVMAVWHRVLGADDLAPDSDYFALGGTSIAGISVLRSLEDEFGIQLTFADLYAHRTVRDLAARVAQLRAEGGSAGAHQDIPVLPRGGPLPVSFGQEQLWYLDRLNPGTALYNITHDLRLRGPLDQAALTAAVGDLVDRHEVLRTRIAADDDGVPHALVRTEEHRVAVHDLSALPEDERHREARRLIDEDALLSFDLAGGPLVRTALLRLGDDDHVLLWTYHHIVYDGWSPTAFFRDLGEFYRARLAGRAPELPELGAQYADFAAWQRRRLADGVLAEGLRFWRGALAGLRADELPLDRPRTATRDFTGAMVEFEVTGEQAERIRRFSRQQGVTSFVTMLAVVDTLLHRWAGHTDVVIGVATSGRVNPATHDLIGYFNNVLPFRTSTEGSPPFTELVRRCARTVADVLDHEEVPLEKVVADVLGRRDPGRHPLFDVAYTYQNVPQDTAELGGLDCSRYLDGAIVGIAPGTAKFDLTVGVVDQGEGPMSGYIEYATALFDRSTAERLAKWLPEIVAEVTADPERPPHPIPTPAPAPQWREPQPMRPLAHSPNGAPRAEQVLTAVVADLLALDDVKPGDNFFDLGGDSVLGVRVAARAAKAGVHVTPQQLLQCRTIDELALVAAVDGHEPEPAQAPDRHIPLTPIMHHFLEHVPDGNADFVEVQVFELTSTAVTAEHARAAVEHLLARHEPLRYRFRGNSLSLHAECAPPGDTPFDVSVLPPMDEQRERERIAADCRDLRTDLDLKRGPVVRARYYQRGHGRSALLVLLVHHFVFDNMSTVVLMDDLDAALTDLVAGRALAPQPHAPGWRRWSEHLRDMSTSDTLAAELDYWTAIAHAGADLGLPPGDGGGGTARYFLDTVPTTDSASEREVALCAVAHGLAQWSGTAGAYLEVEGEATPSAYRHAGRGPAVGWFTTLHPVVLPIEPGATARDCLPDVVDRVRSVPNDGVGHGMLRHLSPHNPAVARFRALPEPQAILLHAPSDMAAFDAGVRLIRMRWDLAVNLKQAVSTWFPLIVAVAERESRLCVELTSVDRFSQAELEAVAARIGAAFTALADG
ncbi:condensation domain-containing protein [Actinokineospora sp. PR83]|uniref:condensation domain-containing protein n=1 Tax=Actinokineospora sp. PR83 TaxID=2884908 RepID=UPI0027E025D4|nr:condensation domain-containing protein [Actinokineospora sp. PR83]MCG8919819.1 condensation domain-containing protein [Actinokineospora sp. PR83]